ncbi:hypothetical protein D3C76_838850 [compost metagenome]
MPLEVTLDAQRQVQILRGVRVPATDFHQETATERAKGPGNVIDQVPFGQTDFRHMDRQQVLQRLHRCHPGTPDIAHTQATGYRRHLRVLEMPHDGSDHVVVEGCIAIERHHDFAAGKRQAGVEGRHPATPLPFGDRP